MPWKEDFVTHLGSAGISINESDLPDTPQAVWEALTEIGQWWDKLDSQTKAVIKYCGSDVADGLRNAGFGNQWSQLTSILERGGSFVLPDTFNQVARAWDGLRESIDPNEHYNDMDFEEYEAIRNAAVGDISDY